MARIFFIGASVLCENSIVSEISVDENQSKQVIAFPLKSGTFTMISVTIQCRNGKIERNDALIITQKSECYQVEFCFKTPILSLPQTVRQLFINDYSVTYYKAANSNLLIERGDAYLDITPKEQIIESTLALYCERGFIIISAKTCNNSDYILLIRGDNLSVQMEMTGEISFFGQGFTLKKRFNDMKKHVVREQYLLSNSAVTKTGFSTICENEHIFISELVPWLFMEAIFVGDYTEAISYLDNSIVQQGEYLQEFFSELIALDNVCNYDKGEVGVFEGDYQYKRLVVYRFEMQGDKITNIIMPDS